MPPMYIAMPLYALLQPFTSLPNSRHVAGVARVPQHEEVAGHSVEDRLQRARLSGAADDRRVRRLALLGELLAQLVVRARAQQLGPS